MCGKRTIILILLFVFWVSAAQAAWQETLENHFDIVETFDELADWTGSGYGDVYNSSPGIWNYYSYWDKASPSGKWIGVHDGYVWDSAAPKNLKMSYSDSTGPSRFGLYFGDTSKPSASSGYTDLYLFYMVYIPSSAYPTSTDSGGGGTWSYSKSSGYAYTGYYKFGTFNKGCVSATSDCGLYSDNRNYSTYHIVPQMAVMGGWDSDSSSPSLRVQTTDSGNYTFFEPTSVLLPLGKWIGIEFHLKNYSDNGQSKVLLESWYYDSDGIQHVLHAKSSDIDNSQSVTDAWNNFFFGGNIYGAPDSSMNTVHYVDDFIVNGSRIGPTYFQLINGNSSGVQVEPPPNVQIKIN